MEKHSGAALAVSAAGFLLVILLIFGWVQDIRFSSIRRQKESLELALNRSLMLCYCLEGSYPANLEELLEEYPLNYDHDLFVIDYRLQGSNILPEITILESPR